MKNIKVSIKKATDAFGVLNTAKYGKLDDADKIKVWKIARALKPIATKFDDDTKDAAEKFKPEGFDEKFAKAQQYEKDKNEGKKDLPMPEKDYIEFVGELRSYNQLVSNAVNENLGKECEISFEPISEDAFGKLMASNEWTMEQVMQLGIIIAD